jgi:NhaP-type Na+/H+ or K+/H+ antiporter
LPSLSQGRSPYRTVSLLLLFSITLLLAVLLSERAERTLLSTSVLFLLTGALAGRQSLGLVHVEAHDPIVSTLAELALFSVLFTDSMKLGIRDLIQGWRLPGRALFIGFPLTLAGTALLAHWLVPLPWTESLLIGAILSPTDPVFVAAIIGNQEIPARLRNLLNIESGLNDGLALPAVLFLLARISDAQTSLFHLAVELAIGLGCGITIPWLAVHLEKSRLFAASKVFTPLFPVAIACLVYALSKVLHGNEYLAAFAAGVTVTSLDPQLLDEFHVLGESVTELLKLAALLVFGSLLSLPFLSSIPFAGYVFALLALIVVRPLALSLSFLLRSLSWPEFLTAAWFGPKGFASVTYALIVLQANAHYGSLIFQLCAVVIGISIIAHSSTDVSVSKWLQKQPDPRLESGVSGQPTVLKTK